MNESNLRIAIINSRGPAKPARSDDHLSITKEQFGKKTGGAMLKAGELADELQKRGHQTAMMFYEGEGEAGWSGWDDTPQTRYIKPTEEHLQRAEDIKREHQLRDHELDVAELALALLLLDIQHEFDVIDIRGFGIFLWNAFTRDFLFDKLKTPVVWTPAGEGVFDDLKPNPQHYSMVAPLAEAMRQQALFHGFDENKVQTIPNAVDSDYFAPDQNLRMQTRQELGISESQPVFVFSGRIDTTKKVDVLVKAWERLIKESSLNPVLLVIGEPQQGQYKWERFYGELKEAGLNQNIVTLGAQDREGVKKYLAAGDFFVFPSQREGMSGAIMEACAMELVPILDQDTSGNLDLAAQTGLLYKRGENDEETIKALYDQLHNAGKMFATPDFQNLKHQNRRNMKENFSWLKKVERYEALFKRAIIGN